METNLFNDFHTCETCLIKDICNNSKVKTKKSTRPCNMCTRRCYSFPMERRKNGWSCGSRHCMFEIKEENKEGERT